MSNECSLLLICVMLVMTVTGKEEDFSYVRKNEENAMTIPQHQNNVPGDTPIIEQDIPSVFSDFDLYLFGQGKNYRIYEKMGAHVRTVNGVSGVHFAVWAPNALAVSVVGDFNNWERGKNPMHLRHKDLGVWECFVPGLQAGALYKYAIFSRYNNYTVEKTDPYGFAAELRPLTASIVAEIHQHEWQDDGWIQQRLQRQQTSSPISIYEVHLGSWRHIPERRVEGNPEESRFLTYRELAHALAAYVKDVGFTHIELMPVSEYPLDGSWGYQVTGYYAPTSRFGPPEDFQYFVDYMHQQGIGVLLDWVPAHFPKDGHALSYFDGTYLYEYADTRKGEHKEWGTLVFNYGRSEVQNFLIANALFWLREYHIDGLRVDAVASMLYLDYLRKSGEWAPNQYGGREHLEAVDFLRKLNEAVYAEQPGTLTIAEESTAWPLVSRPTYVGGLGFSMKWNMGWMHDMWGHPGKKLLFMGGEFGQWHEWNYAESLDWHLLESPSDPHHAQLHDFVRDLNKIYQQEPALSILDCDPEGFSWIDVHDSDNSVVSFMRRGKNLDDTVIFVCNFTPVVRHGYRLGVPFAGGYYEIINSDADRYGGSGLENLQPMPSGPLYWQSCPHSIQLTLPPLATIVLKGRPDLGEEVQDDE